MDLEMQLWFLCAVTWGWGGAGVSMQRQCCRTHCIPHPLQLPACSSGCGTPSPELFRIPSCSNWLQTPHGHGQVS